MGVHLCLAKRKADRSARVAAHDNTFEKIAREWLQKKSHRWDPANAKTITQRPEADVFPTSPIIR